jgi:hypothetical protein
VQSQPASFPQPDQFFRRQIVRSADFAADESGGKLSVLPPVIFKIEIVLGHIN